MSYRCPNCHVDLVGTKCPSCHMSWILEPNFICPDCKREYYAVGKFVSCPGCASDKAEVEKQYWQDKAIEVKLVADDIVAKILNGVSK